MHEGRGAHKAVKSLRLSGSFVFIGSVYLLGMLLFSAMRVLFYFSLSDRAVLSDSGLVLKAFLVGIRFDQVVVLIMLLPLLLYLPWVDMSRRVWSWITCALPSVLFSAATLLLLADIRYYSYFDSHLDFRSIEYFNQGNTFWHLVFSDPRFTVYIVVWVAATVVSAFVIRFLYRRTASMPVRSSYIVHVVTFVLLVGLFGLGIRGRLGIAPMKWSLAYISQDHFVNQLGLNGLYTLGRAYLEEGNDPRLSYMDESDRFPFMDFSEAIESVRTMLHQEGDIWLNPDSSLMRQVPQPEAGFGFQPNLVLVIMESWSGRSTSALGDERNLTPNFDRLADSGILFTKIYSASTRTSYGLAALLCGFPSLPGRSVMTRYHSVHPFITLSELLHQRGYYNLLLYGGDLLFDNVEGFFAEKQYNRFVGEEDFDSDAIFAKWGVPDHVVFDRAVAMLDSIPRPFQTTILTLSNHEPFDLPDSSVQRYWDTSDTSREYNCLLYADHALGGFVEAFSDQPVFDSTLFVFVSDHCLWGYYRWLTDPLNFHIPLLIYSPVLLGTRGHTIDKQGSQTDFIPTIMGILGSDYVHASFGRDLRRLDGDDTGFAIVNLKDRAAMSEDGVTWCIEHVPGSQYMARIDTLSGAMWYVQDSLPGDFERLLGRIRIWLQVGEQLSTPQEASGASLPAEAVRP